MMDRIKFVWPDKSGATKGAFAIVRRLRAAGFEAYLAGGAVRDAVLMRPVKEIDIATSATPAEVRKLFKKTIPTGEKHGTVTVRFDLSSNSPPRQGRRVNQYEVTTFRSEGPYLDARRPSRVKFITSAEDDAQRRDFTINALFYDPGSRGIIDYVGGLADLKARQIEFVGDPEDRILEDALRMLRAVRLTTVLRFELTHPTIKAIKKHAARIKKISAERVKQELDRIMMSDRASVGFGTLDAVGLLAHILPEVEGMKGVGQPKNFHSEGDVYTHTLLALEQFDGSYDLPTRWAVLFHDLGKGPTREIRGGKITFYNHQEVGAEIAKKICRRLKFSSAEEQKIVWLVRTHMVIFEMAKMRLGTRRKWALSPYFEEFLRVYRADSQAALRPGGKGSFDAKLYNLAQRTLREVRATPVLQKPLLSGDEVMKILKIKPGPLVGKVLRAIDEQKLAGKLKTKYEARKFLQKNKKLLAR